MYAEELKTPKDIEIKFHRLTPPILNTLSLPLSGVYNSLDVDESQDYPLKSKFRNFDIPSNNCVNMENLFSINNGFGKIFTNEKLEGIITLANLSDHQITVKDLKITLGVDEKIENNKIKEKEQSFDIKIPSTNSIIELHPKKGYPIKIKTQLNLASRYRIDINFHTRSSAYDNQYYKLKQRTIVKENNEYYTITGGSVEFFINKKLMFDVNNPFRITEIFHNSNINVCLIEIRISNNTNYPLTISDVLLTPKDKDDKRLELVQSLENIKKNYNQNLPDTKFLTMQPDEQIIILFKIDDINIINDEDKFKLYIKWLNFFDLMTKTFEYEFKNNLNTYNNFFKMSVVEKPEKDIIVNQNFKIVINLQTKNPKVKYMISLRQENLKENDKSNDREIEIIDIIEKKIELNSKTPSNNFALICKSDIIGSVHLPKLKFIIFEGNKMNPTEFIYDELLSFNCVSKND